MMLESVESNFYEKAEKYWSEVDPTLNGVLGGFGYISDIDLRASDKFLTQILKEEGGPDSTRALDCGAGIGRITSGLLIKHFEKVDLVEQNDAFLKEAETSLHGNERLGELHNCALQNFQPSAQYDLIWCQWVLGHLTDSDLCDFLQRCTAALRPRGVIVIKENVSQKDEIHDETDSSVTRPASQFLRIFKSAPLQVIRQATQSNFPDGLFTVKMFALRPITKAKSNENPRRHLKSST